MIHPAFRPLLLAGLLSLSPFVKAQDGWCTVYTDVSLRKADGRSVMLGRTYPTHIASQISVQLAPGDSVVFDLWGITECYEYINPQLKLRRVPPGQYPSPNTLVLETRYGYGPFTLAEAGSYLFEVSDGYYFPTFAVLHITTSEELQPVLLHVGSDWISPRPVWAKAGPGDTISPPHVNVELGPSQWAYVNYTMPGGIRTYVELDVRFAENGQVPTLDDPLFETVPLGQTGHAFKEPGTYLFTAHGPEVSGSGQLYVTVTGGATASTIPRSVAYQFIKVAADGTETPVGTTAPGATTGLEVDLADGDSLRVDQILDTLWDQPPHLMVYFHEPGWLNVPAEVTDSLVYWYAADVPGPLFAHTGTYSFTSFSGMEEFAYFPNLQSMPATYVFVNSPPVQLDLVLAIFHGDGTADELLRVTDDTLPGEPLGIVLMPGDSLRARAEGNWMTPAFRAYPTVLGATPTPSGATTVPPMDSAGWRTLKSDRSYWLKLSGGNNDFLLRQASIHVERIHPDVPLRAMLQRADGTSEELAYSAGPGDALVLDIELVPGDSIRFERVLTSDHCTQTKLLVRQGTGWELANDHDPLVLDQPIADTGLLFSGVGSFRFDLEAECPINSGRIFIRLNHVPVAFLHLNVQAANGEETFLGWVAGGMADLHLQRTLLPGDSLLVRTGFQEGDCDEMTLKVHVRTDGTPATGDDPLYHEGPLLGTGGYRMAASGNFLFLLDQACLANTPRVNVDLTVDNTSGIATLTVDVPWIHYADGFLHLQPAAGKLEVRDLTGRLLLDREGTMNGLIPFMDHPTGIYLATLTRNGERSTLRFVVR